MLLEERFILVTLRSSVSTSSNIYYFSIGLFCLRETGVDSNIYIATIKLAEVLSDQIYLNGLLYYLTTYQILGSPIGLHHHSRLSILTPFPPGLPLFPTTLFMELA